uniref:Uncharacterized protein n=1 Tax=Aplanochytrium stocchinoi TaxID=215587 RepID=A0A7S3PFK2_9STRA|mmetsp:Transcript_9996/g.12962  ORF Transcript_9996/g.12962 Transcript_9996/m.12962 type:complete len:648 (+) Transcript_9996:219-2162(+)
MYHGNDISEIICSTNDEPQKETRSQSPKKMEAENIKGHGIDFEIPVTMSWSPFAKHLNSLRNNEGVNINISYQDESEDEDNSTPADRVAKENAHEEDEPVHDRENHPYANRSLNISDVWMKPKIIENVPKVCDSEGVDGKAAKPELEIIVATLQNVIYDFESIIFVALKRVKLAELRRRGYRLHGLLPPIARIEYNEKVNWKSRNKSGKLIHEFECSSLRMCIREELIRVVGALRFFLEGANVAHDNFERDKYRGIPECWHLAEENEILIWSLEKRLRHYLQMRAFSFKYLRRPHSQLIQNLVTVFDDFKSQKRNAAPSDLFDSFICAQKNLKHTMDHDSISDQMPCERKDRDQQLTQAEIQEKMAYHSRQIKVKLATKDLEEKLSEMNTDLFRFRQNSISSPTRKECSDRSEDLTIAFPKLLSELNLLWANLEKEINLLRRSEHGNDAKNNRVTVSPMLESCRISPVDAVNGEYMNNVSSNNNLDTKSFSDDKENENVTVVFKGRVQREDKRIRTYPEEDTMNMDTMANGDRIQVFGELQNVLKVRQDILPPEEHRNITDRRDEGKTNFVSDYDSDSDDEDANDSNSDTSEQEQEISLQMQAQLLPQPCPIKTNLLDQLNVAIISKQRVSAESSCVEYEVVTECEG